MMQPFAPDWVDTEWGQTKPYPEWRDGWVPKDGMVVHWGGGPNTAGSVTGVHAEQIADEEQVLRGWESFHIGPSRGWRGIAYNFAVGQSGRVYALRGWRNTNGAHYGSDDIDYDGVGANLEKIAVCFILGSGQTPTAHAYAGFDRLRAWCAEQAGWPMPCWTHSEVAGSGGHSTTCPGPDLTGMVEATRLETSWPRLLRQGDRHERVATLRGLLVIAGAVPATRTFTRYLDRKTRRYQEEHGLTVDGVVGPATRASLYRTADATKG